MRQTHVMHATLSLRDVKSRGRHKIPSHLRSMRSWPRRTSRVACSRSVLRDVCKVPLVVFLQTMDIPLFSGCGSWPLQLLGEQNLLPVSAEIDQSVNRDTPLELGKCRFESALGAFALLVRLRLDTRLNQEPKLVPQLRWIFAIVFRRACQLSAEDQRPLTPAVLADRAERIGAGVGVGLVIPTRNDGREGVDRLEQEIGKVGAAMMAGLGHIGFEDCSRRSDERFPLGQIGRSRIAPGVVPQKVFFGGNIEVAAEKEANVSIDQPQHHRMPVFRFSVVALAAKASQGRLAIEAFLCGPEHLDLDRAVGSETGQEAIANINRPDPTDPSIRPYPRNMRG
jgi:hypothetical protein